MLILSTWIRIQEMSRILLGFPAEKNISADSAEIVMKLFPSSAEKSLRICLKVMFMDNLLFHQSYNEYNFTFVST